MPFMNLKKINTLVKNTVTDAHVRAWAYLLINFKSHCIIVTDTDIRFIKFSGFTGKIKKQWSIPLDHIGDVHYEGGGAGSVDARFILKTTDGKVYKCKVTQAPGFSGKPNFGYMENVYKLLTQ